MITLEEHNIGIVGYGVYFFPEHTQVFISGQMFLYWHDYEMCKTETGAGADKKIYQINLMERVHMWVYKCCI